ncbi:Translation protein, beta-barrel domain,Translation elongation factor EFTu/EF1A, C- [Cinara cedri]|uniref:Translation protein, beta-barrel domain,Translation elongation factor EFTu/EF1A, C n=1 Tax=Cinara cedri TaxID=506608 RepID=A0A5E4MHZ0_9HEMI|nr:Translation protein, beta-barrel domain,Translation elongation factor EFTu/EF1A, C- [Cinara cedri]
MARHRNIRTTQYSDDEYYDDDDYSNSFEEDYISPSDAIYLINHKPKLNSEQDLTDAKVNSCLQRITEILGIELAKDVVTNHLINNDFNIDKTVDQILNSNIGATKVKDLSGTEGRLSRPPSVVIASSSKNKDNIIVGFGNASISGSKNKNLITTPKQTPFSTPICSPAVTPRNRSPQNTNLGSPRVDRKINSPKSNKVRDDLTVPSTHKDQLYLIIIGHVDAGKSTLMGHLLYKLGHVQQRTIQKYEHESRKLGKQSFVYAWVLDETAEERNRGITMDVGHLKFETKTKDVTLLDAPGHKDFIPNMITGASQADATILVVDATKGEFETGFDSGGQTREHALLIRSLGITQLGVAVNKMDTVNWSEIRFEEIKSKLGLFLKQAGYKESDVTFIPCSGLNGENLAIKANESLLTHWYNGPCLMDVIDSFKPPERAISKPLRLCVSDVYKSTGSGFSIVGRVETGQLRVGDKVLVEPQGEIAQIKSIEIDELPQSIGLAGDFISISLNGYDAQTIYSGCVLCDISSPIPVTSVLEARVVVFNVDFPIVRGHQVVLHYQSSSESAVVSRLLAELNKSTGEMIKKNPRIIKKNTHALIKIQLSRPICVEVYSDIRQLGRVMLRSNGTTIAAGLVTKVNFTK